MRLARALLITGGATLLLGLIVGTATARRLEVSSSTFRLTFARIRFESNLNPIVNCVLTMEGSLHATTIAKVAGTLVGYITRATLGPCETGRATILRESLPWHVRYGSFTGTLPAINRVELQVVHMQIRLLTFETPCLHQTTAEQPLRVYLLREAGGAISEVEAEARRLQTGCGLDFDEIIARGGAVTVLSATTRVTVRLI